MFTLDKRYPSAKVLYLSSSAGQLPPLKAQNTCSLSFSYVCIVFVVVVIVLVVFLLKGWIISSLGNITLNNEEGKGITLVLNLNDDVYFCHHV